MIKFFRRHLTEFIGNMPPPTTTRAFVGYLSFFLEPALDMKQKLFPRRKLKTYPIQAVDKWIKRD